MGACYRRLALAAAVWEFPLAGCWRVLLSSPHHPAFLSPCVCMCVCSAGGVGGAVCFCSWLPEKHPAHASAAALVRQWQRCLAFRARGQGGASHHLPTKAQVTQPASALPHFLPSPHGSPHPTAGPAEKTKGASPLFPPSHLPGHPPPIPFAFMVQYFHLSSKKPTAFFSFSSSHVFKKKILCPHVSVWTKG